MRSRSLTIESQTTLGSREGKVTVSNRSPTMSCSPWTELVKAKMMEIKIKINETKR